MKRHLEKRKINDQDREELIEWITKNTGNATVSEIISYIDAVGSTVYESMRRGDGARPMNLEDFKKEKIQIRDYQVFLRKMKLKFSSKYNHKLSIFQDMEKLVQGVR